MSALRLVMGHDCSRPCSPSAGSLAVRAGGERIRIRRRRPSCLHTAVDLESHVTEALRIATMRVKSRRRRVFKWAGFVGCIVIGAVFARSLRHVDQWLAPNDGVLLGIEQGACFLILDPNIPHHPGVELKRGFSSSLLHNALIWLPRARLVQHFANGGMLHG